LITAAWTRVAWENRSFSPAPKTNKNFAAIEEVGTWSPTEYTRLRSSQQSEGPSFDDEDILNRRGFGGGEDEEDEELSWSGIPPEAFHCSHLHSQTRDVTSRTSRIADWAEISNAEDEVKR